MLRLRVSLDEGQQTDQRPEIMTVLSLQLRGSGENAQSSRNMIQVGAWSLECSHPLTGLSTSAPSRSFATSGLNRKWSIRRPASRVYAFRK
jgi:hypothetical protein